ncbi:MAG: glucoamylase family protein [Bacteroidota bacterium]
MKYCLPLLLLLFACAAPTEGEQAPEPELMLSDEALLDKLQQACFQYFWSGAEPNSGMARERYHLDEPELDAHVVTSGGSGFGILAILVGMERGFISRKEGIERLQKMADFLEGADRFHGVWPHWLDGRTGEVIPFSPKDDGGDLVETAFLAEGLLCARQYLQAGSAEEQTLASQLDELWRGIEWDWHQNGEAVLFWHWSPNHGWDMDFRLTGYNECLIAYVLGAASPTHPIAPAAYHKGWAREGAIRTSVTQYGHELTLSHNYAEAYGGPLFWSHYSFVGLDPRELADAYANYWTHNRNHALINYEWCVDNPEDHVGYGPNCWGLTASYSPGIFYSAHQPNNDLGVITPTAALASFPYTPKESMAALRHFHDDLGDRLWGEYGPHDAFHLGNNWFPPHYLAIDQGPIVSMVENHRSGLLWELFMSCPEVQRGLENLGFE